jgi:hypothetical protein
MKGLLTGLVVFLVLPIAALAQGSGANSIGYVCPGVRDFTGGGARAMGMGRAFLGVSDDASAVGWNPAGLYRKDSPFEQPVMAVEYNSFKGKGEYQLDGFQGHQVFDADGTFDGWSMVSFLAPVRIKGHPFVISGSYHRLDDEFWNGGYSFDTAYYFSVNGSNPVRVPITTSLTTVYHSGVNALAVGFGTRLYQDLSFGLSFNRYAGTSCFERVYRRVQDGILTNDGRQRAVRINDDAVLDTAAYSGVFLKAGLFYEGPRLSAGLVFSTPHKLIQTIDRIDSTAQYSNGKLDPYEGTETSYIDNVLVEVEQPMVIGGGVGFRVTPNLLWALDLEYRPYSGKELRLRDSLRLNPGGTDVEYYSTFETTWNNTFAIRTGAEYVWMTGRTLVPAVPIRAGFGYIQVPSASVDDNFNTMMAAKTELSVGAGVHWQQIHLDFAYLHSSLTWETTGLAVVVSDVEVLDTELASTNNRFKVTFTGFF